MSFDLLINFCITFKKIIKQIARFYHLSLQQNV